ncbi:MAG TPA: aldose 1-epimerase family protein [Chitinophagales bacterium]
MVIENDFLKVKVRELGAELTSVFDKKNETEHLWQADANIWNWHAPTLFPIVGCVRNDEILVDGKKYKIEKHGFARKTNFKFVEQTALYLVFETESNETTKVQYPFNFRFQIIYWLSEKELFVRYTIINTDTKEILFSVGGHPAFNVPFFENEKYEDYYIEFENDTNLERHHINADGFFDGRKSLVLNGTNKLQLHTQIFKDDALIFKNLKSKKVTIRSKNHNHFLSVSFSDFNYLGLWAKTNAPYVCIEPWLGCADDASTGSAQGNNFDKEFQEKEGIIRLPVGETFSAEYMIRIG